MLMMVMAIIAQRNFNFCLPQELHQRCERMRPMLFRLASDTEDNDEALGKWSQSSPDAFDEGVNPVRCTRQYFKVLVSVA